MDGVHPGGGSTGLGRLIDQFGEYIACDLQETYGVDLRDLMVSGSGVTPRWVLVLLKGLPLESRFFSEQRGGQQFKGWGPDRYATVALINAVRALNHNFVCANATRRPKPPDPYPTPHEKVAQAAVPGSFAHTVKSLAAAARKKRAA